MLKRLLLLGFLCAATFLLLGLMVDGGVPQPPRAQRAEVPFIQASGKGDGAVAKVRPILIGKAAVWALHSPALSRRHVAADDGTSRLSHRVSCYYAFHLSGRAG